MSSLMIKRVAASLTRQSLCQYIPTNTPRVITCCCTRHYHDTNDTYKYWSFDNPGLHRKDDTFRTFMKRNLRYQWLAIKDTLAAPNPDMVDEQSRVIWQYEGPESVNSFLVSSDEVMGGKSKAYVTSSRNNKLLFYGKVDTTVPRDGETERSGYCYMQLKQRYGAFNKEYLMDFRKFNKLTLRVRGDGRAYMVNMKPEMYWSDNKNDLYNYVFYTRGGPYWQDISLPFSKFFLTSGGRLQDRQAPMMMDKVKWIGIMLGDKVDGEFSLEIDNIKVEYDPSHFEEFAYEKYGGFKL
ncbi:complex I intermediate-associated protein 30, mitochondrial-like [Amphiura filiformis]|uniref:complex I intermediate-associated protein 30, mitochondrial-like n=1 Tax=Amphiura filiformis TaxID=82378 RepID=UPI003B225F8E